MPKDRSPTPRAARTRAAILGAAEAIFAEKGFAATRLEDVAERVGIRRASIVYYFRDKRELYDAVLEDVFGCLLERVRAALAAPGPLPARAEGAVGAWFDTVSERPSLARLLLREVADGAPSMRRHTGAFSELVRKLLDESPSERLAGDDVASEAARLASLVAGSTIFLVAGLPVLMPELSFDALGPHPLAVHRREVLGIVRRFFSAGARSSRRLETARLARRSP
jgi:TetR/AcrR family transcriptional regulator